MIQDYWLHQWSSQSSIYSHLQVENDIHYVSDTLWRIQVDVYGQESAAVLTTKITEQILIMKSNERQGFCVGDR